jgi:hypothetical protein
MPEARATRGVSKTGEMAEQQRYYHARGQSGKRISTSEFPAQLPSFRGLVGDVVLGIHGRPFDAGIVARYTRDDLGRVVRLAVSGGAHMDAKGVAPRASGSGIWRGRVC